VENAGRVCGLGGNLKNRPVISYPVYITLKKTKWKYNH
jgi:hypothetical protein